MFHLLRPETAGVPLRCAANSPSLAQSLPDGAVSRSVLDRSSSLVLSMQVCDLTATIQGSRSTSSPQESRPWPTRQTREEAGSLSPRSMFDRHGGCSSWESWTSPTSATWSTCKTITIAPISGILARASRRSLAPCRSVYLCALPWGPIQAVPASDASSSPREDTLDTARRPTVCAQPRIPLRCSNGKS